jgi:hypothetical protein
MTDLLVPSLDKIAIRKLVFPADLLQIIGEIVVEWSSIDIGFEAHIDVLRSLPEGRAALRRLYEADKRNRNIKIADFRRRFRFWQQLVSAFFPKGLPESVQTIIGHIGRARDIREWVIHAQIAKKDDGGFHLLLSQDGATKQQVISRAQLVAWRDQVRKANSYFSAFVVGSTIAALDASSGKSP